MHDAAGAESPDVGCFCIRQDPWMTALKGYRGGVRHGDLGGFVRSRVDGLLNRVTRRLRRGRIDVFVLDLNATAV